MFVSLVESSSYSGRNNNRSACFSFDVIKTKSFADCVLSILPFASSRATPMAANAGRTSSVAPFP
jgi:hypothetical protein